MGSRAYVIATRARPRRGDSVLLEVGSEQGEGSTAFLARLGPRFYSVDVDPQASRRAGAVPNVVAINGLAEEVLEGWGEISQNSLIRFAWLDGHDWPYPDFAPDDIRVQYEKRGQIFTRDASALSHARISALIEPWMSIGGIIAFDDTWASAAGFNGKGRDAVPLLLERKFVILEQPSKSCVALKRI